MRWRFLSLVGISLSIGACAGSCRAEGSGAASATLDSIGGCQIAAGSTAPLVVEWNGATRGKVEALRAKQVIAVRQSGCQIEVLPACTVKSEYAYVPLTLKRDRVVMRDDAELYANLPLNAVSLSGKLHAAGELNVDMTMVGRFEARASSITHKMLDGDCAGVTHVITGLTTGAFEFYAGSASDRAAGIQLASLGGGAKSSSSVEILNHDGDPTVCATTKAGDTTPPFGCGAVIRIELTAIGAPPTTPSCAKSLMWDGKQCASMSHESGPNPSGNGAGTGTAPYPSASGAMVRIPGGSFRWNGEQPVSVAEFDLDLTKVTVAQFKACVEAGKCVPPESASSECNWGKDGRDRHPINCVTWSEAKTFCDWTGSRLPTEIEWQYAEIGQTGSKYPWGNEEPDDTRACKAYNGATCAVGRFPAGKSRFGILDMSSSTYEWMLDAWCQGGLQCSGPEPRGCGCTGMSHAVRDGLPATQRSDVRNGESNTNLSFRCARSLPHAATPQTCPTGTSYALDQCVANHGSMCPSGMHHKGNACLPD